MRSTRRGRGPPQGTGRGIPGRGRAVTDGRDRAHGPDRARPVRPWIARRGSTPASGCGGGVRPHRPGRNRARGGATYARCAARPPSPPGRGGRDGRRAGAAAAVRPRGQGPEAAGAQPPRRGGAWTQGSHHARRRRGAIARPRERERRRRCVCRGRGGRRDRAPRTPRLDLLGLESLLRLLSSASSATGGGGVGGWPRAGRRGGPRMPRRAAARPPIGAPPLASFSAGPCALARLGRRARLGRGQLASSFSDAMRAASDCSCSSRSASSSSLPVDALLRWRHASIFSARLSLSAVSSPPKTRGLDVHAELLQEVDDVLARQAQVRRELEDPTFNIRLPSLPGSSPAHSPTGAGSASASSAAALAADTRRRLLGQAARFSSCSAARRSASTRSGFHAPRLQPSAARAASRCSASARAAAAASRIFSRSWTNALDGGQLLVRHLHEVGQPAHARVDELLGGLVGQAVGLQDCAVLHDALHARISASTSGASPPRS